MFRSWSVSVSLFLLISVPPGAAQTQTPPPRAVVEQSVKDLGIVAFGTDPEAAFTIENRGAGPLEVVVTPVAIGLRVVEADRTIAPSASGTIRVAVDTFRAGMTTEWKVSATTNDPAAPALELTVKADVRNFLTVEPSAARFNFVQHGPEGGTFHVVSAQDDAPLEVLGVESPVDFITAKWRELKTKEERVEDVPGRQWRIDLTIKGDAAVGPIGGYAIVRTSHPRQPRAFIPVTGFVRPLFAVTPATIRLTGQPEIGSDRPFGTLVVKNFGEPALDITNVTSDLPGLRATIVPVDAGHSWRVELRRDAAAGPDSGSAGDWTSGTLRLTTTHPQVKELTVPLTVPAPAATPLPKPAGAAGPLTPNLSPQSGPRERGRDPLSPSRGEG